MDFFPSDLFAFIFETTEREKNPILRYKIIRQLDSALCYLAEQRILHRDLKPSNILVGNNFNIRICDFDTAYALKERENFMTEKRDFTTYEYAPREVLQEYQYSFASERHAFGVIVFNLFTGQCPFSQIFLKYYHPHNRAGLRIAISSAFQRKWRPLIPQTVPPAIREIIETSWAEDPNVRLGSHALILALEIPKAAVQMPLSFDDKDLFDD